jgi:hypothetical protein
MITPTHEWTMSAADLDLVGWSRQITFHLFAS